MDLQVFRQPPPPNVTLWNVNYFQLKTVKTLQAPEKLYLFLKELGDLPIIRVATRNNVL